MEGCRCGEDTAASGGGLLGGGAEAAVEGTASAVDALQLYFMSALPVTAPS